LKKNPTLNFKKDFVYFQNWFLPFSGDGKKVAQTIYVGSRKKSWKKEK
jgi:hypothetical protein